MDKGYCESNVTLEPGSFWHVVLFDNAFFVAEILTAQFLSEVSIFTTFNEDMILSIKM